jgi:hypothetical protein
MVESDNCLVSNALVRYINSGVTLGSVNMAEVTLRSLTLEERNHARVIFIHHNVPGVLRKGMILRCGFYGSADFKSVNEILGDHNVDKQITDNKGDVRINSSSFKYQSTYTYRLHISWRILAMFRPAKSRKSLIAWSP